MPSHLIETPTDCLDLLVCNTPACEYMTHLRIKMDYSMIQDLGDGQLLQALHAARGLQVVEIIISSFLPAIINTTGGTEVLALSYELFHVKQVILVSWWPYSGGIFNGLSQLAMAIEERNKEWAQSR